MRYISSLMGLVFLTAFSTAALADDIKVAVTTSFHNSGLSDILLPEIKKDLGLDVHLLVVGTGQALKLGRAGDVDAILVHSRNAEDTFVTEGYSTHRREIMYNDFVIVGPDSDPAGISTAGKANEALAKIADAEAIFVSRGDDSGTHRKETALWQTAGQNPESFDVSWYREAGAGMGATLNTAVGMDAYVISDRASWLKFKNKGDSKILFSGDPVLFNQYAYLPISKEKHAHVKDELALQLEEWLVSKKAQDIIGSYTIGGETLFTPNANASGGT